MGFLLNLVPWWGRILAIVAILVAAAGFGAVKMHSHDQVKYEALQLEYAAFKADVTAKGQAQEAHTAIVVAAQQQKTKEVSNDYAKKLADLRSYYSKRLRNATRPRSSQVPSVPQSPLPVDATPAYVELAGACAETTQQLISLQEWVREQAR